MTTRTGARPQPERGASSVEYAFLVSLIALVILVAVAYFGGSTSGLFQRSCESLAYSTQSSGC